MIGYYNSVKFNYLEIRNKNSVLFIVWCKMINMIFNKGWNTHTLIEALIEIEFIIYVDAYF